MNKKVVFVLLAVFAIVAAGLAMTQDVKSLLTPAKPAVAEAPAPVAATPTTTAPSETVAADAPVDDCCAAETPLNAKIGETGPRIQKGQGQGGMACAMPADQQCADCQ